MLFACADCMKAMPPSESIKYVTEGAEGGFCNRGKHHFCQKEGCYRKLSMSNRGKDPSKNEEWFVCGARRTKNKYTTKDGQPNFIYDPP